MGYPYEDLDDAQFERLVVELARKLFGIAVQSFAAGADGGRDARFEGTAARFPSESSPWAGVTIFQAKHTNAVNVHFSDRSFSGESESSVLSEEMLRVKNLVESGGIDHYVLVANRRLGANTHQSIQKRISDATGLAYADVFLAGQEFLDDMLRQFPEIPKLARIDPLEGPLLVSSAEIAEVILAVSKELDTNPLHIDPPVVDRVSFESKNLINNLSPEFARALSMRYLPLTAQFDRFLANPMNVAVREQYDSAVEDFQLKIVAHRSEFQSFDKVFNHLTDLLFNRDAVLARSKRLTRAVVFYMYWHCDIGETEDAASQQALPS